MNEIIRYDDSAGSDHLHVREQSARIEYALAAARTAQECGVITNRQCVLLALEPDPNKVLAEVRAWNAINLPLAVAAGLITPLFLQALQLFPTSDIPTAIMQLIQQYGGLGRTPHELIALATHIDDQHTGAQAGDIQRQITYASIRLKEALDAPKQPINLASFPRKVPGQKDGMDEQHA